MLVFWKKKKKICLAGLSELENIGDRFTVTVIIAHSDRENLNNSDNNLNMNKYLYHVQWIFTVRIFYSYKKVQGKQPSILAPQWQSSTLHKKGNKCILQHDHNIYMCISMRKQVSHFSTFTFEGINIFLFF